MGVDIRQEQRIIIKFLAAKVVQSAEIYYPLSAVCKSKTLVRWDMGSSLGPICQRANGDQCGGSKCLHQALKNQGAAICSLCFLRQTRSCSCGLYASGHTVNADYYCMLLSDWLRSAICKSDEVCCRKVSFFNMTMHHHTVAVRQ